MTRYGAIAKSIDAAIQAKVFFVGSSSAAFLGDLLNTFPNDNDGVTRVVTSITAVLALCEVNRGDVIYVLPGYTETVTAAITINKAGVSIIGLGNGTLRPTITGNGTIDAVNITADNVTFDNFHFAAPETDDQTAALNQALERWSKAWRTKDVPTYLSMYAADFAPQQDMDLRTWAENRSARITGKRKIQHQIRDLQIVKEGMVATAQFTQLYADERIQMMNRKTMKWVFRDGRWWISKETSD